MNSKESLKIIRDIVGEEKFSVIMEKLSGATVYFPENYEWQDKVERNISLREDFYTGSYEVADLALKYGLSISRVYKIIQNRDTERGDCCSPRKELKC